MPSKEYYISVRHIFLMMGYQQEVQQLDVHYNMVFLYDRNGKFIKVL